MKINGQKIYLKEIFDFLDELETKKLIRIEQDYDDYSYYLTPKGVREHLADKLRKGLVEKQGYYVYLKDAFDFEDDKLILSKKFLRANRKEGMKVDEET